jgi:hypothetical protein
LSDPKGVIRWHASGAKVVLVENPSGTQTVLGGQTGTAGWTQYSTTFTTGATTTSIDVRAVPGLRSVRRRRAVHFGETSCTCSPCPARN